jgi:hypothetical protein
MIKKSISLIELLIAISLLSLIIIGAGSFHLASSQFLHSSERKTEVLNEMTYILEHMQKYVMQASGDINNPGIDSQNLPTQKRLHIRLANNTPDDLSDDDWVTYRYFTQGANIYTLQFCPPRQDINNCNNWEELSERLIARSGGGDAPGFNFSTYEDDSSLDVNMVRVDSIILRYDPDNNIDTSENPQVSITSPLIFTSFSHSIN